MRPSHPYLEHDAPLAFAHRGGADAHDENSWEAFEHAVSLGYRYLETDVHRTADGVVVAFHDERVDRVTDRTGAIAELTWSEIATLELVGGGRIPRLDELLAAFPEHRFNLDAKHDDVVDPLLEVLDRAAAYERVCLASFSDRRIRRMRDRVGPDACTSMGVAAVARLVASRGPLGFLWPPGHCAQVPVAQGSVTIVDEGLVERAHDRGVPVHVWIVDDPAEMHRLLDLGVDGLMTDRPATLRDVLIERGEW